MCLDEMIFFLSKSAAEQRNLLKAQLPTLEDYWDFRMGTTAVKNFTVLIEYVDVCDTALYSG